MEQDITFHHNVAKLRHDIQTPVAFPTTQVKEPDEDDRRKLKRVLKYLSGTKNLCLNLKAENIGIIEWYVDAAYAIHDDCCDHTSEIITLEKGAIISFSCKQKLNAKSSTEDELIGINEALPQMLCA